MKKFKLIICAVSLAVGLTSCDNYLDLQPESTLGIDQFYTNAVEAEIALAGIYSVFATDQLYCNNISIIMESGTDEGFYNRRFNEAWTVGLYRHTPSDNYVLTTWTSLYKIINLCNLFNEQLKKDSFEDQEEYNRLLAEALFLRAHAYSLLVNWYEKVPMPLTSTKDQSANNLPVSSLEELYGQIIKDYTFASEHLLTAGESGYVQGRASKMAAHGLLARVYLKMAGYPLNDKSKYALAKEQCAIIINSGVHGLTPSSTKTTVDGNGDTKIIVTSDGYRKHFLNYIQSTYDINESIFEISFRYLRDRGLTTDGRIGEVNGIPFAFGGGQPGYPFAFGGFNTTSLLKNSYEANKDSIRKAWNIPGYQFTATGDAIAVTNPLAAQFVPGKYRRWEPANFADLAPNAKPAPGSQEAYIILEQGGIFKNFTNINFPVLRYADILLMYAEADNEVNGAPSALGIQYLDQVRQRAGLLPIAIAKPLAISSKQNFFEEIVDERFRELTFEALRKHDLIRWGLLGEKLKLLEQTIKGEPTYSATNGDHQAFLRPSQFFDPSKHLSLPYPLQEVQLNNSLEQKSNW